MLIHGIGTRLGLLFFFLLMAVMYYSCTQNISAPKNENIEILQTSLELARSENEFLAAQARDTKYEAKSGKLSPS